jgi:ankyrin repeat protein
LYYDAPIDAKSDDGITALHAATWAGNIDIADLLIQNGANMEARDNECYTSFLIASSFGDTLIMDMLYKYRVDIFTRNVYNHNALTLAIAFGHKDAVKYLLGKSDRWKEASSLGYDPYKIAAKYRRKEIADILKSSNIPGKIKLKLDQVALSGSARFTPHDYYTGFSASFKEPYLNAGFTAGLDMKLWYTRILLENSENNYTQYQDKGAMVYAGIFKDINITNKAEKGNYILSTYLSGGYAFGNKFKGTQVTPDNGFKVIPGVSLKWTKNALSFYTSAEYTKMDYYKIGPLWFRIGASYNYYFDNLRTKLKKIKWN